IGAGQTGPIDSAGEELGFEIDRMVSSVRDRRPDPFDAEQRRPLGPGRRDAEQPEPAGEVADGVHGNGKRTLDWAAGPGGCLPVDLPESVGGDGEAPAVDGLGQGGPASDGTQPRTA